MKKQLTQHNIRFCSFFLQQIRRVEISQDDGDVVRGVLGFDLLGLFHGAHEETVF